MKQFTAPLTAVTLGLVTAGHATAQSFDVYYTDDSEDAIKSLQQGTIQPAPGSSPLPADVDLVNDVLYITDFLSDTIYSLPATGGAVTTILDLSGTGGNETIFNIAVDSTGSTVYYGEGDTDSIFSVSTGGGAPTQLVDMNAVFGPSGSGAGYTPRGITIDETNGKLYWSETITDSVYRSNLDGTDAELVFDVGALGDGSTSPNAVAVDPLGGKLYVADNDDFIAVANLDGSGASVLVDLDASGFDGGRTSWGPEDLEFLDGRLYVGDTSLNGVWSINSTGSGFQVNVTSTNVRGVAAIPEPTSLAILGLSGLLLGRRRRQA